MATTRPKLKSNMFVTEAEVSRKHQISARRLGRPKQLRSTGMNQRRVRVQNPR